MTFIVSSEKEILVIIFLLFISLMKCVATEVAIAVGRLQIGLVGMSLKTANVMPFPV